VVATQQHKQKQELDPSGCVLARAPSRKHRCLKGGKRKLGLQSESELHVHTKAKLRKEESISQQSVSPAASRSSITIVCLMTVPKEAPLISKVRKTLPLTQ
jgi:hypothetical protein